MYDIIHLVYASAATRQLSTHDVDDIIKRSLDYNLKNNITGMLLFAEGSFLQVLEGAQEKVEELFFDIKTDNRHTDIIKIYQEKMDKRYFGQWRMGLASMSHLDLSRIPGCESFFESGQHISLISETTARSLLQAFTHGKWRRHIK